MATRNHKPGSRRHQTKSKNHAKQSHHPTPAFTNQLGSKLLALDDNLYHVISTYQFYHAAIYALSADDRIMDDRLLMGLSLMGSWLGQKGNRLLEELRSVRAWVKDSDKPGTNPSNQIHQG